MISQTLNILKIGMNKNDIIDQMALRCKHDMNLINKSFHLKGDRDICVILVHGWTSTPYEMRMLAEYLHACGFGVDAPLLSGHGLQPENLENVTGNMWIKDIKKAFQRVKKQYTNVYIGGMSIGGNLALCTAAQHTDVNGLILMSTPYNFKFEKIGVPVMHVAKKFIKYKKKVYPYFSKPALTQLISYQYYPTESTFEVRNVVKKSLEKLDKINQPVLLIQPKHDHLIAQKSAYKFFNKIKSSQKRVRYINDATHNFMGNNAYKDVFQDIVQFVEHNSYNIK